MIHFGVNAAHLAAQFARVAATASDHPVLGVDHRITLDHALASLMVDRLAMPLQGNINPALLFAGRQALHAHAEDVIRRGRAAPGHVVNLGHGVPPDTDPDVLTRLVELVHSIPPEN